MAAAAAAVASQQLAHGADLEILRGDAVRRAARRARGAGGAAAAPGGQILPGGEVPGLLGVRVGHGDGGEERLRAPRRVDEIVERAEAAHPQRQEAPGAQRPRQPAGPVSLQEGDRPPDGEGRREGAEHGVERRGAGEGEQEDGDGEEEERGDEVEGGEPAVLGRGVAEALRERDGPAHARHGVEDEDADDVEEEVHEGDLSMTIAMTKSTAPGKCRT